MTSREWVEAITPDTIVVMCWPYQSEEIIMRGTVCKRSGKVTYEDHGTVGQWCADQGIDFVQCPERLIYRIAPKNDAEAMFAKLRWY